MKHLLVFSSVFFLFSCNSAQDNEFKSVAPDEFKQGMHAENSILLDVRTAEEYEEGHIENCINIDFYAANFKDDLAALNRSKDIYVYCRSGGRSKKTAQLLNELGFKTVYELDCGFNCYQ